MAEALAEECPVPLVRVGCRDEFGEVGPEDYLKKRYGMTAGDIASNATKALQRKGRYFSR